ncbi:MAG TPA: hypothetical protein VK752_07215 [Bryobacteraceae bacterium]|jgi:hypothetical protein|nr:hypothetical protein [Bryobacteraceae bacterium]
MKRTPGGSVFLSCLLLTNLLGAKTLPDPYTDPQAAPVLNIVIVEGEGTLNNVKQRVNREPIVQVEDENHKPVAGAAVVFFLPTSGPSGTFANGSQTLTVTTDATGRAAATGIHPNHTLGKMQIRVTASANGLSASAVITQTNIAGANVGRGLSPTAKIIIIAAVAAGIGAGVYFGVRGSGTGPQTGITITPGTPTVGAPQ